MRSRLIVGPSEAELSNDDHNDAEIIEQCLGGDQKAWGVLLDKYRKLIHSIPPKYGACPEDAADIFQAVSLDIFSDLAQLREPAALRAWLIRVTSRKCLQWKHARQRAKAHLIEVRLNLPNCLIISPTLLELESGQEEQRLREAVARLPDRFRWLIHMLFYDQPPRSYKEIAETLGLARGSIPFLRARCLKRLQQVLEEIETEYRASNVHPHRRVIPAAREG